jgi:hypothetical protein
MGITIVRSHASKFHQTCWIPSSSGQPSSNFERMQLCCSYDPDTKDICVSMIH